MFLFIFCWKLFKSIFSLDLLFTFNLLLIIFLVDFDSFKLILYLRFFLNELACIVIEDGDVDILFLFSSVIFIFCNFLLIKLYELCSKAELLKLLNILVRIVFVGNKELIYCFFIFLFELFLVLINILCFLLLLFSQNTFFVSFFFRSY